MSYSVSTMDAVDWVRQHAANIQQWIGEPPQEPGTLYVYRGLHAGMDSDALDLGWPVAVSVFVPYQSAPFAQVQLAYQGDGEAARKLTGGPYITATELAVFMGLGATPPDEIVWLRQELHEVNALPPHEPVIVENLT